VRSGISQPPVRNASFSLPTVDAAISNAKVAASHARGVAKDVKDEAPAIRWVLFKQRVRELFNKIADLLVLGAAWSGLTREGFADGARQRVRVAHQKDSDNSIAQRNIDAAYAVSSASVDDTNTKRVVSYVATQESREIAMPLNNSYSTGSMGAQTVGGSPKFRRSSSEPTKGSSWSLFFWRSSSERKTATNPNNKKLKIKQSTPILIKLWCDIRDLFSSSK